MSQSRLSQSRLSQSGYGRRKNTDLSIPPADSVESLEKQRRRERARSASQCSSVIFRRSSASRKKSVLITQLYSDDDSDVDSDVRRISQSVDRSDLSSAPKERIQETQAYKSRGTRGKGTSAPPIVDIENDEGFDTDMEIDEDDFLLSKHEDFDPTYMMAYTKMCDKLGVVPVSYLKKHITDTEFTMKYHGLGPNGTKALAVPLEHNSTMEKVNLQGNHIEGEGAVSLAHALSENNYITNLNLSENDLKSLGCKALCEALADNTTMQAFNISGNKFKDDDARYVHDLLLKNETMSELYLDHNKFEETGALWLCHALSQNTTVRVLDLSWNHIRGKGAKYIGTMIQENYGIRKLNLAMNGLSDEGARHIGHALLHNNSLEELNLMENRISQQGAVSIARGLVKNETLQILRIGFNPIGQEGARALLLACEKNENSDLTLLDLSNVVVGEKFVLIQKRVEKKNVNLDIIHGGVLYLPKKLNSKAVDLLEAFESDPMTKLKRFANMAQVRLADLFKQFDVDNSWTVTREEFACGIDNLMKILKKQNPGVVLEFTEKDVDLLMVKLDKDGDGEIDYGELILGDIQNKAQKLSLMRRQREEETRQIREAREEMKLLGLAGKA